MGTTTDYSKNKFLDHIYNTAYTPVSTIYLALFIGDPEDAGAEVATDNYARTAISFGSAASRRVTQDAEVAFPQAGGAWGGTITHYGLYDAATAGNRLASGSFSTGFAIVSGNTPKVASGQCYVEISATATGAGINTVTANKLLDLMFNNTAYSTPKNTLYLAMSNSTLDDADALTADFTEQTGTGYSRTSLPSASIGAASSGAITNTAAVTLATPTAADWTEVVSLVVMDASTAGNIIGYDNANVVDQTPGSGDTIEIPIGDFDHAIN